MTKYETATILQGLDPRQVGMSIRFHREILGYSLDTLGKEVGCSRQTISNYEHGRNYLLNKIKFLDKLTKALGIDMHQLLECAGFYDKDGSLKK